MQNLKVIKCPDSVSGALVNPWKATESCQQSGRKGQRFWHKSPKVTVADRHKARQQHLLDVSL